MTAPRRAVPGPADRMPVGRAQTVLQRLGREEFDESEAPYKPAETLARFRNRLIHYRPEWRTAGAAPGDYWIAKGCPVNDL
jgi:hypothetical protein